jgi:hypothetical protein
MTGGFGQYDSVETSHDDFLYVSSQLRKICVNVLFPQEWVFAHYRIGDQRLHSGETSSWFIGEDYCLRDRGSGMAGRDAALFANL